MTPGLRSSEGHGESMAWFISLGVPKMSIWIMVTSSLGEGRTVRVRRSEEVWTIIALGLVGLCGWLDAGAGKQTGSPTEKIAHPDPKCLVSVLW